LTCQSNRFIDNSNNNFAITRNGDTSIQAFAPFAPTAAYSTANVGGSLYLDGTGDYLSIGTTSSFNFLHNSTALFTIEGWIYLNAVGSARGIVGKGTGTTGWLLSINSSNQVVFTDTTTAITSTGTLSVSTWYHIAVVRSTTGTNQTKIYINGTNDGTGTSATNFSQTNLLYVGADRTGGSAFNGYIEDLRITKGVARYTANFTAPTAAFPTR
jgi:hypothetical protein